MDIERLQEFCLSMPATTEDVKWGDNLVFSVGQKMFCIADLEPPFRCSFKVREEDFDELCVREGFMPAPYMARAKWVTVTNNSRMSNAEWEAFIKQSYELVKAKLPRKTRLSLGI